MYTHIFEGFCADFKNDVYAFTTSNISRVPGAELHWFKFTLENECLKLADTDPCAVKFIAAAD